MKQVKVLFSESDLQKRVREIGVQISADLQKAKIKHVVVIGILKGSFIFMADLVRSLDVLCDCEFLGVSSYGDATESSGEVKVTHDISKPLKDQHVLLVEDIADTGLTLNFLQKTMKSRGVASIRTAVCFSKPSKMKKECKLDYVGFEIGPDFVVGYGLDAAGKYRNLPHVAVMQP